MHKTPQLCENSAYCGNCGVYGNQMKTL